MPYQTLPNTCAQCGAAFTKACIPVRGATELERHSGSPVALVCSITCFQGYTSAHPGTGGPFGPATFPKPVAGCAE
jgi:hypothetical protein